MNITQSTVSDLTLQLTMQIVESDYINEVNKTLAQYRRKANVPGFRPGMVPAGMIKKMYGESVVAEVVSNLIGQELEKYIAQEGLATLGQPMPDTSIQQQIDFRSDKDFTFYYLVGIKPNINLTIDQSIEANYSNILFDEEDVDQYLLDIRRQMGSQSDGEHISLGDLVNGELYQWADGKRLEAGFTNLNASLQTDSIQDESTLNLFIGKIKGDAVVFNPNAAFQNRSKLVAFVGAPVEQTADLDADYEFVVNEIKHTELAEMNEKLFSAIYQDAAIFSEEELRSRIRVDIEQTYKAQSERTFFNDMIQKLIELTNLNLPDDFLKTWILESNAREEADKRITPEQLEVQYIYYRDTLRWQLIEEYIVVNNNMMITEDELRGRIKEILGLQAFGGDMDGNEEILNQITDSVMKNKEEVKKLTDQILEQKLTSFFKEKVKLNEMSMRYDDFKEMIIESSLKTIS